MNDDSWTGFLAARTPELGAKLVEHLWWLTFLPMLLAGLLGVPLGIRLARMPRLRSLLLAGVGVIQTVPSLAMLALLLALFGRIGKPPAIVALALYALLPIVRNTVTGLAGVPGAVIEAAEGLGFSRRQRLWWVELPLALPVILAGVRTATVICVGIATLSTFIGAGGLGDLINRGLATSNVRLVVLGAGAAAALALTLDGALGLAEGWLAPGKPPPRLRWKTALFGTSIVLLAGAGWWSRPVPATTVVEGVGEARPTIRIGSKNFTEQLILGELLAQLLEADGRFTVERVFNLGGTIICHQALLNGEIDLYPEYTGTALTTLLNEPVPDEPSRVGRMVRRAYAERFDCRWLDPFGFDNTYALTVPRALADQYGWRSISDLQAAAGDLRAGFTSEFRERADGYPGLQRAYGFQFGDVRDLGPELMYAAAAGGEVDVICAFATDGRIAAYELQVLEDDRGFFPPYQAAPVVREDVIEAHAGLAERLNRLAHQLDDATMRRLNFEVDEDGQEPAAVAQEFLRRRGLL
ncbi:MAG: ABC transporter permease subunit [Verrucomicrobiales bacterium]|nr:ABC transporter permease subunit [Verrucomicrobiales bacterium]